MSHFIPESLGSYIHVCSYILQHVEIRIWFLMLSTIKLIMKCLLKIRSTVNYCCILRFSVYFRFSIVKIMMVGNRCGVAGRKCLHASDCVCSHSPVLRVLDELCILFSGAQACVLSFSTVDRDSFEAIESWKRKVGQPARKAVCKDCLFQK